MKPLKEEKKRKSFNSICSGGESSGIDTGSGSTLYYYWSGGARQEVDKYENKMKLEERGNSLGETEVTTTSTASEQEVVGSLSATTSEGLTATPPKSNSIGDDDLLITKSASDADDDGISCCHCNFCVCHQTLATKNTVIDQCSHQNHFENCANLSRSICRPCSHDDHLIDKRMPSSGGGFKNEVILREMLRCNTRSEERTVAENYVSVPFNISSFKRRGTNLSGNRERKSNKTMVSGRDMETSTFSTVLDNVDLKKMLQSREKNSPTTRSSPVATTSSYSQQLSVQSYSSIKKDPEWKRKKKRKSIKRDTDEVDMSSVDESVPRLPPPLRRLTTASTIVTTSSSCSPLNNLVSGFTSWPFILGKYIRLGHLFMTPEARLFPEAKSVPFTESSKTLDKCGTSHVDGGDQLDVRTKEHHQVKDYDYEHHHLYLSPTVKTENQNRSPKEKEFLKVDLLENSCRYQTVPLTRKNDNKQTSSYRSKEKQHQHCFNQQQHGGKWKPNQKSRKPFFLSPVWIIALVTASWINPCFAQGPVIEVQAVAHKKAILPCDMNAPIRADDAILVLWYKDLGDMPIYSYDGRNRPGTHAKNEALLGQRAYFRTVTEPAALQIDNVSENDAGLYRCRVDFLKSPTRNSKVNLTVIVPPQKPTIFDGQARELGGIAGPYNEASSMSLTCFAYGGHPSPKVTWWRGGSLIDDTFQIISSGATQNTMMVDKLSRADLHAVYTCQASNNNLSEPISSSVQVEMYFRPLEVTLLGSNQPMSALQEIEIVCQSVGSRPPAEVSWYKDGQHLKSNREEVSPTGNISTSVLKLTPRVGDHGKSLTCRAENSRLEGSALEDSWKLAVFFIPILTLKLGSNLDPDNIREGGDVYLECIIHANPWVYKVVWEHNGHVVQHNASAGIIMSNQSLVLQKVKRASGGTYVCTATNIEGEGRSNPVELSVMYKPICKSEQKRVFGVAKGEQVEIECKVDANPQAESFRWAFNNSADSIDVPQARVSTPKLGSSSVLRYTPHTELDYGSVVCISTNVIGHQAEPCLFTIIPAGFKMRASVGHGIYRQHYLGKPDAPFNCTTQNITSESLEVECLEGFDGGLPQVFHADIVDAGTSRLLWNLTSQIPFFVINGLKPGQALRVFVHASNRKGASDTFILEAQTIQEAEKRTASPVDFELTPILGVCVGVVCGLLVVALGIVLALKFRSDTRHPPPLKATKTEYRVDVNDSEEKNPDIIPSSKDSDFFYNDGLYNGPKRNGSITDNFRNCTYYSDKSNSEITYAELCLDAPGPNGNPGMIGPGGGGVGGGVGSVGVGGVVGGGWSTVDRKRRRNPLDDPASNFVIYATIDHSQMRTNGEPPAHLQPHQREIVSVRTPLLVNSQQESCV